MQRSPGVVCESKKKILKYLCTTQSEKLRNEVDYPINIKDLSKLLPSFTDLWNVLPGFRKRNAHLQLLSWKDFVCWNNPWNLWHPRKHIYHLYLQYMTIIVPDNVSSAMQISLHWILFKITFQLCMSCSSHVFRMFGGWCLNLRGLFIIPSKY